MDMWPAWYHEDNLFPSRERMDRVQAPIVERAALVLGGRGGRVLDLGCGNGALLEKVVAASPGAVPFGMEIVPGRVAHARELMPRFAAHFLAGDIFSAEDRERLPGPFDLVLLSPRRLQEAGPGRSAALRDWIRARTRHLLVYAYGRGLTEYGNLAGFARAGGIQLAHPDADLRADLAVAY